MYVLKMLILNIEDHLSSVFKHEISSSRIISCINQFIFCRTLIGLFSVGKVKVCDICGDAGREDLLAVCSRCSDGAEHT